MTIRSLIRQGEHQQLDFKYCISDSRKIAKTLTAFANADGGTLLLGVRDNGSIAGAERILSNLISVGIIEYDLTEKGCRYLPGSNFDRAEIGYS